MGGVASSQDWCMQLASFLFGVDVSFVIVVCGGSGGIDEIVIVIVKQQSLIISV